MTAFTSPTTFPRRSKSSLRAALNTTTLRLDAKQAQQRFTDYDAWLGDRDTFRLGDVLPTPIVKGDQPTYRDDITDGVRVITTMAIQQLAIDEAGCRLSDSVNYGPGEIRRPREGDVLLTTDGGSSIGKPVVFDLSGEWAVDSHVAILRPSGLDSELLAYLLASPIGQLQFNRAESGASGQTAVVESDIRRFRFPRYTDAEAQRFVQTIRHARAEAARLRREAAEREKTMWDFLH